MIIDTHCHIDLYEKPYTLLKECIKERITLISMTNLPSHFELGFPFFKNTKNIRLALGMHPLYAQKHESEFNIFLKNIEKTSYIGEIGLDFSKEGINSKEIQLESFNKILECISDKKKILSIHSRKAENEVLELLLKYKIKNAIFHWYSGEIPLIDKILASGYFFSINPAMIKTTKGQSIISRIPLSRVLTESDGPFVIFNKRTIHPLDIKIVIQYISNIRNINSSDIELQIQANFYELISRIK